MQTIILVEHVKDALPFPTGETEEVHGGIVHAEKHREHSRLLISQKMSMGRLTVTISTRQKIEI
jgi:hypothetical protein